METAYLRPRDPYGAGLAPGAGPAPSVSVINNMKHATFPRSARAERESSGGSPRKPPPQPSCDCCPYGYHIDLDFVRFCERLAGAGGGSASQSATKARRRERRRQRQSMDVLLGLAAPPDQPQVWTIEQTLPQLPPSPVSLPPHASMLVRDALQRAVKDFEEALERSSPATVSLSPLPALPVLPATPATPPPRVPPRRYQLESVSTCGHHARESSSSPGGRAAGQAAGQAVNARILEQALDAGLWAAASAAPAAPALQNIRQQIARSLERMRELEEEVKMIPVLQVQLSVMQEEKRKMLLQIRKSQPTIKQNGVSHAHLDVLKIEEPVRNGAPPAPPPRPTSLDGLGPAVNGTGPAGPTGPKRRPASVRDVGVGCTVLTRDVGLMPPPARLRTVAVGTDPVRSEEAQPSPNRLSKSSVYTEDIPYVPPRTSARGVQTAATDAASRGCQTDTQPAPPPPARPTTRDTGVQVQPASVQRTHAGVTARPSTADAGVSCAPRTRDAASSDCTVDDVLCAGCRARQGVRTRSVGVETTPVRAEAEAGSRMCLSLSALDAAPTPAAVPVPAAPKPQTRTVGCGTASDRAGPFAVNRGVNTDAVVAAVAVHRGVNTDAVPTPTKPTTVSRAVLADLRAATASRATSTDTPRTATTSRATNTDARAATAARATNTEGVPRRDAGTATVRRQTVDAGITCSLVDPARLAAPSHTTAAARAPSPAPPSTPTTPTPQSRIPRPSSTTPQTSPGPPPRRQFKRQDTYTKEPQPAPPSLPALPTPAADVTSKSPRQPPCPADAASRKSSAVAPAAPSTPRRQHRQQQQQQRQQQRQHPPLESESEDSEAEQAVAQADEDLQAHSKPKPIPGEPRIKSEPSKEMAAALKVLDDHLQMKSTPRPGAAVPQELRNAFSIAQLEWFKVSSTKSADPLEVEDYLDYLELKSTALLEYVINMTDNSGNTAMHYAVSHGNFDVVSVLLDSKVCNVDVTNTAGYTSVMLVSLAQIRSETHRHVVRRLFHLADVNSRAKQHGQTALMLAVSHGRLDTVRLLLEAGADVNIQDEDGSTALMCAAEHGHLDIIKLLLAQPDCDVTVVDHDGSTALGIAMEAGHRDIGVLLYAQEHFSRGSSPYNSLKMRRARSVTPTARPLSGSGLPTALPAASASPAASAGTPPPARRTPTGPPPAPAPPARGKTS